MRLLFGPTKLEFANRYLQTPRQTGELLTFGPGTGVDVPLTPSEGWAALAERLPAGWLPELLVMWLPYTRVAPAVWDAPIPTVALAPDWNLLWHAYRHLLPVFDAVLTDTPGVDAFGKIGLDHARPANLFGLGREYFDEWDQPTTERDLDLVFVGNLHGAVQRPRLPWLGRIAALASRYRVRIASHVFGADYRALLRRAKIVFNHSARGECNQRSFEALACGALLVQEADNREVPDFLTPDREYAPYTADDLEAVLDRYLADDALRERVATAGRSRVRSYGFWPLIEAAIHRLQNEWDAVVARTQRRRMSSRTVPLTGRVWATLGSETSTDPLLAAEAEAIGAWSAVGLFASEPSERARALARAAPANRSARLAWVQALGGGGQTDDAVAEGRTLLDALATGRPLTATECDTLPSLGGFDLIRVEWERAAWIHAGQPAAEAAEKARLLTARAHTLLADLTGDLSHYHSAVFERPDLPPGRAALGCALARVGRCAEAMPHLRAAVEANPFDRDAARALYQTLWDAGEIVAARQFAWTRRILATATPNVIPVEDWFAADGPIGDELVSIIVLCCNEVAYTRQCLESVLRHTHPAYELILVDNGSTDGTPEYLAEITTRVGPVRVDVIRNAANRGYAGGVNQGLAAARGEWFVLLNNDVVVTPGWLDRLLSVAVSGDRPAGLVGPITNAAPPPQFVNAPYQDLADLNRFADLRARADRVAFTPVERLTGFCLLVSRTLVTAVGVLDEGYGTGFFEDDDLCLRARRAGFPLRLARGVYVHHFGNRTFVALGIDTETQLRENLAKYRAKWGDTEADRYRSSETTSLPARPQRGMRVSLTMIVKNEEQNLPACLGAVQGLFDEVVVVDTGSSDRTREIAAQFGARVSEFPWIDHFAAARNAALDRATGDYAFWLDADDRLDPTNRGKLETLLRSLQDDHTAYVVKCRCVPDRPGGTATIVDHVRLFRLRPDVRWAYRVHEQILPALRRTGAEVRWSEVTVDHVGYVDPAVRGRKLERDLRLLERELADDPNEPFVLFNLGSVYHELNRLDAALDAIKRSLAASHPTDSIVRKLYALEAQCLRQQSRVREALDAVSRGRTLYPDDAELLFLEGVLRRDAGDLAGAAQSFRSLLTGSDSEHFGSVDTGLRGPKARHNLAVVHLDQGLRAEAEAQWRHALVEDPDFLPALVGLGELALRFQDWGAAERVATDLEGRGHEGAIEAAALRARSRIARGEFAAARTILGVAALRYPGVVLFRVLESHAWLKEGTDEAAAERSLRTVLALDPANREARSNLEVLLRRQGRWLEGVGDATGPVG